MESSLQIIDLSLRVGFTFGIERGWVGTAMLEQASKNFCKCRNLA
jgi:hypothetical protein